MATANRTGETNLTMPSDPEIVVTRVFDAPRRLILDTYTKCEHLRQWLLGADDWKVDICGIDLRSSQAGVTLTVDAGAVGSTGDVRVR